MCSHAFNFHTNTVISDPFSYPARYNLVPRAFSLAGNEVEQDGVENRDYAYGVL